VYLASVGEPSLQSFDTKSFVIMFDSDSITKDSPLES
jgi:hypothetical protein